MTDRIDARIYEEVNTYNNEKSYSVELSRDGVIFDMESFGSIRPAADYVRRNLNPNDFAMVFSHGELDSTPSYAEVEAVALGLSGRWDGNDECPF